MEPSKSLVTKRLVGLTATGEAKQFISGGDEMVFYDGYEEGGITYRTAPEGWEDGNLLETIYWDNEWKERAPNPTVLDGRFLKNVPENALIYIDGEEYPCEEGGEVELDFPLQGTYQIIVKSPIHSTVMVSYENYP